MEGASYIQLVSDSDVVYHLRDTDSAIVDEWEKAFSKHQDKIKVSMGDIFKGAPAVDAVVSPSNSFGFLNGGVDGCCRTHFGQQIENRLRNIIQKKYNGEILLGQAIIIQSDGKASKECNGGVAIQYLIFAPTLRVPADVSNTPNAYLCFRAILLAVREHNRNPENIPIRSVLLPGLGTGCGKIPKARCAQQMLQAYETIVTRVYPLRLAPKNLKSMEKDHNTMCASTGEKSK